jgi:hypothetical protein
VKPHPESENVQEACCKIAKVIQPFPELRFQIFGAGDFTIAAIKDTEHLKNGRGDNEANVIAA